MTNSLWRKRQEPEALKLALEAYLCREMPAGTVIGDPKWWVPKIANAIKEALAQPEQEPVAWKLVPIDPTDEMLKAMDECSTEGYDERLYAGHAASVYMAAVDVAPTPPQRKPLTDGEIWDLHIKMSAAIDCKLSDLIELTRAVEAAHGIKE